MSKLYKVLKEILLKKNQEYKYYIAVIDELCQSNISNSEDAKQVTLYIEVLDNFFEKYDQKIVQYEEIIALNYFRFLERFYQYIALESYSINYLKEYRICTIRIMELALFMQERNLLVNDVFFDDKYETFYEKLLDIYQIQIDSQTEMKDKSYEIKQLEEIITIHKNGICIQNGDLLTKYISSGKMPVGFATKATLRLYLKLNDEGVYHVFYLKKASTKTWGKGGTPLRLIPLDVHPKQVFYENKLVKKQEKNNLHSNSYEQDIKDNLYGSDEEYERTSKSNKRILSKSGDLYSIKDSQKQYNKYVDEDKYKINTTSNDNTNRYKRLKLDTAIGHLQTKSNLNLPSNYNLPNINLLAEFSQTIAEIKTFESKLIILSILLGIDFKQLVGMMLTMNKDIYRSRNKINIRLSTAYAEIKDFDTFQKSKKMIEFELPEKTVGIIKNLENDLLEQLKNEVLEKKELWGDDVNRTFNEATTVNKLNTFIEDNFSQSEAQIIYENLLQEINAKLTKFLTIQKRLFRKTIHINMRYLHLFSFGYYKLLHKESEINHLFLKQKTANIHTKLSYVRTTRIITKMSYWIDEFSNDLGLEDLTGRIECVSIDTEYAGSDKIISPKTFKTFLNILTNIKFENQYANLTLKMIYLRSIFSIILGSRKYHFSANLMQYSKVEKLLFIQEKEKHTFSSKRMIPITDLGDRYIQYFYKLKEKYNIESYSIGIFKDDGKLLDYSNENLLNWTKQNDIEIKKSLSNEDYKAFYQFISSVPYDFGRHIFASIAHNGREISQDSVDAFLNHYDKGTQDQGMYSLFSNQNYIREVRTLMSQIEKQYIPYAKFLDER